jgi:hypothetical protein
MPNRTKLNSPAWTISPSPIPNEKATACKLAEGPDRRFTHWGIVECADGTPFSVEQGANLLDTLHLFLSFANRQPCAPALVQGLDAGWNRLSVDRLDAKWPSRGRQNRLRATMWKFQPVSR